MHELGHRSRDCEQPPKAQLSGISPVLQLREKLKCLTPMGQRVLAKISGTNGRDFYYGDSVIVLCLSLQRWLLLSGNKNNIYVGSKHITYF